MDILNVDLRVEKVKKKIDSNLNFQYIQNIIKLQAYYEIYDRKSYNYQSFQTFILILNNIFIFE